MVRKHQQRAHREKYLIPLKKTQRHQVYPEETAMKPVKTKTKLKLQKELTLEPKSGPKTKTKLKVKLPEIAKKVLAIKLPAAKTKTKLLKVKFPGIAKNISYKTENRAQTQSTNHQQEKVRSLKSKTKIAGYSYNHKMTRKTMTVRSYTKKVLECLDK